MNSFTKPDRLSHIKRSLEIGSIIFYADEYISTNDILTKYDEHNDRDKNTDESTVKRAIKTIHAFLKLEIFESKTSKGYRLKKKFKEKKTGSCPSFLNTYF